MSCPHHKQIDLVRGSFRCCLENHALALRSRLLVSLASPSLSVPTLPAVLMGPLGMFLASSSSFVKCERSPFNQLLGINALFSSSPSAFNTSAHSSAD